MLDEIAETGRTAGTSQPQKTESRVSRRAEAGREIEGERRRIERQIWDSEVPSLIPEALSETTNPPPRHVHAYEYERRRMESKRATIARILRDYPIDELLEGVAPDSPARTLLNALYPDLHQYCDAYVDGARMEREARERLKHRDL
ncbi:hypothetical protein [Halofilum ochraceum]|uniref:hypothetical protein n=1 Tax=Halofilum ochraceum TaxID=1611323 RepID=UPI0008DAE207|nr:hypothetical protein [Halofilum ochraceum]